MLEVDLLEEGALRLLTGDTGRRTACAARQHLFKQFWRLHGLPRSLSERESVG